MSYDVWLEADLGGAEPAHLSILCENYTYNVAPMLHASCGSTPNDWDGIKARTVRSICYRILEEFDSDPAKYRLMEPVNGWGDFEGARSFITKIKGACETAPNAVFRSA